MGRKARHYGTEAEGLEPPCACARRISSAVPYQLGLRLQVVISLGTIGAPGFEPGTSASRTQRSTGLSHAPYDRATRAGTDKPRTDGVGFEPTRACTHTISNRAP